MAVVVRAFPVLPGKESRLRQMAEELGDARRNEAAAFYRGFGVRHESWHLQLTPHGSWVIALTELSGDAEVTGKEYAASEKEFDRWFKQQVRDITGIDPDVEPLGPPTETLFDWQRF